jgi:hypothetical protein
MTFVAGDHVPLVGIAIEHGLRLLALKTLTPLPRHALSAFFFDAELLGDLAV